MQDLCDAINWKIGKHFRRIKKCLKMTDAENVKS